VTAVPKRIAGPWGPRLKDLADYLYDISQSLDPADFGDDEAECGDSLEVRLQVQEEYGWSVHTGDSQYDQDHRGAWGVGYVGANCSHDEALSLARELLDEAADAIAEMEV
jgi:hypothetical protein